MATRLFFPLDDPSPVNPSFTDWGNTASALRRKLAPTKGASALTNGASLAFTSGTTALDRQYVSPPMPAGISFNAATVKLQILAKESGTNDNTTSRLKVYIVSKDGQTVQQTLLSLAQYGPATELLNTGVRNKTFADGDTVTGTYTTVDGDRLVVEIGYTDAAGTTPEGLCQWGENGTDLAENETATTGNGWVEFSNTITFLSEESLKPAMINTSVMI